MKRLNTFLFIFFFSLSVNSTEYYSASLLGANWKIKTGRSFCQLQQNIPLYGDANFTHHSGQLLRFSIRENRFKSEIVKASLFIDKPAWVHESPPIKNFFVSLDQNLNIQNYPRLSVYGETAETMLDLLTKGFNPTFIYKRAALGSLSAETNVAILPINFSNKYNQFIDCRKNFLPAGIKDALEKSFFYNFANKKLNTKAIMHLKKTARYLKEVKDSKVVLVSDTAKAGKRDNKWFLARADIIAKKLKTLGVPKSKIQVKKGDYANKSNKVIRLGIYGPDALKVFYYRKGNIQLTLLEKQRLELLAHYLLEYQPQQKLVIKSHTDAKGSRARNLKVSQKRADVIKNYLITQGLSAEKVLVKAYGESKPLTSNRFPTGRAKNRRVIIDFIV